MYVYTLIYTHTHKRTHIYTNPWKGFQCSLRFKGHPYFRITFNTITTSLLLSIIFATLMLDVMLWINKLHCSSQLKIKETIRFKMSLKINIVSVWKEKSKFGETVSTFSPLLFRIQVKIYLKDKWENTQLDNCHAYLFSQY